MEPLKVRNETKQQPAPTKKKFSAKLPKVSKKSKLIACGVIVLVATFLLGMSYGIHKQKKANKGYLGSASKNSALATNRWTSVGKITEVSDSKIKIKDSRGQEKEAEITKDTKIVNRKGETVTVKDLKNDQRVIASGEKDGDKLKATRIRLEE